MRVEALCDGVLLDIQGTVFDAPAAVAEARLGLREETGGDVGIHVLEPPGRKLGQDRRGRRPRSRADLDHPQPPSLGERSYQGPHRLRQHLVRRSRDGRLQVQVGRRRLSAAEQEREGVLAAAEHVGQREAGAPKQADFRESVGIKARHFGRELVEIPRQVLRQRVVRPHEDAEAVRRLLGNARPGEHLEHAAEETPVFRKDIQLLPQPLRVHRLPGRPPPAQILERLEGARVRPALQVREEGVSVVRIDARVRQVAGEQLGALRDGGGAREEIGGIDALRKGALAPCDLVQQILDPLDRREQRLPRGPLHRVAA